MMYEQENWKKYDSKVVLHVLEMIDRGKFSMALRELKDYQENYPSDIFSMLLYAKCLQKMEDSLQLDEASINRNHREIKKIYSKIIKEEPTFQSKAYHGLALLKEKEEDYVAAEEYFKKAIHYGEGSAKKDLLLLLCKRRRYEEALELGNTMNDFSPNQKIKILYELHRYRQALKEVDNTDLTTFDEIQKKKFIKIKSKVYFENGRILEATEMMEKYILDFPEYSDAHLLLLRCYLSQGGARIAEAFSLANELSECNDYRYQNYARICLGNIYEKVGNRKEAYKIYTDIITSPYEKNENAKMFSYLQLGQLEFLKGNFKKAMSFLEQIDESDLKRQAIKYLYLAIPCIRMKKFQDANKYFNSIKDYSFLKEDRFYYQVKSMIAVNLGLSFPIKEYFDEQLVCPRKSKLLNHIRKEHIRGTLTSYFNDSINLNSVVRKVPSLIKKGIMLENSTIENYLVKYPAIGYVNDTSTDYMNVVLIADTNIILTMYPVIPITEEHILIDDSKKGNKQKKKSRIDRFNERYGSNYKP